MRRRKWNISCYTLVLFAFALLLKQIPCNADEKVVVGSGLTTFDMRYPGSFTKIDMEGTGRLIIGPIGQSEIKVVAEVNILPFISTKIEGDTLFIRENGHLKPTQGIIVYAGFKQLAALTVRGTVEASNEGLLNVDDLVLQASGEGQILLTQLFGNSLSLTLSNTASATLKGEIKRQQIEIKGVGNYNGIGLLADKTTVRIDGSGFAQINAIKQLDAAITGTGYIGYLGDPAIVKKLSPTGTLKKIQDIEIQ